MSQPIVNPYIGPRSFREEEHELFFGRQREVEDLLSLFMVDHCILFFAPSGAGKTSLLNTKLRPRLHDELGFEVLPTARVSGEYPGPRSAVKNIFAYNVISHLDQGTLDTAALAQVPLSSYLFAGSQPAPSEATEGVRNRVLIIDQFEEIFTTSQQDWELRGDFFRQLRELLTADPAVTGQRFWVLLAMREEYIADLDPYEPILPGKLRTRYYMPPLRSKAAIEAVAGPAKLAGRPFEPEAALALVKDLSLIHAPGLAKPVPGEFVEPLQLQVVCYQLWEDLQRTRPGPTISPQDVAGDRSLAASVDAVLARFYNDTVLGETLKAARERGISAYEDELRTWFAEELITNAQTRNLVRRGDTSTGSAPNSLPNELIDLLAKTAIFHEVKRPGRAEIWYELTHDRMIAPILEANRCWYEQYPLIGQARQWLQKGRPGGMLLRGDLRREVQGEGWRDRSRLVQEYIAASEDEHQKRKAEREAQADLVRKQHEVDLANTRADLEHKSMLHLRRYVVALATAVVLMLILAGVTIVAQRQAAAAQQQAAAARQQAAAAQQEAAAAQQEVIIKQQQIDIENARRQLSNQIALNLVEDARHDLASYPQRSLLLAAQAVRTSAQANGTTLPNIITTTQEVIIGTAGFPLRDIDNTVVQIRDPLLVAASPDGRWLAAVDQSGITYLWDLRANTERAVESIKRSKEEEYATSLAISERWLAIGKANGTIEWIDLAAAERPRSSLTQPTGGSVLTAIAVSPTSDLLATGDLSGTVRLYDLSAREATARAIPGLGSRALQLAFSPNGERLAMVDVNDTLQVWSLADNGSAQSAMLSKNKNGLLAFSPDGAWLAIASEKSSSVQIWSLQAPDQAAFELVRGGELANVRCLAFDPQGAHLVVGHDDGRVIVWSTPKPDGNLAPAAATIAQSPIVLDHYDFLLEGHTGSVLALSFGQSGGAWLATGSADDTVRIWDMRTMPPAPDSPLYGHEDDVQRIFRGPEGKSLITVGGDGQIRFWSHDENHAVMTLSPDQLVELAMRKAGRGFTDAEQAELPLDLEVKP